MIFQTNGPDVGRDLQAFLALTAARQARFDAAPESLPVACPGVNDQQRRLHPGSRTLRLCEKRVAANGLLFVTLRTEGGPAAVFRPGQQARVYGEGVSYPVFLVSAPEEALSGLYTLGADPAAQPEVCRFLEALPEGGPVTLRAPVGDFYYSGLRDRGPFAFVCDRSGLPAAAAFAGAARAEDGAAFYCVDCAPEPFFDGRFRVLRSLEELPPFDGVRTAFVCGGRAFCAAVKNAGGLSRARFCETEPPRRETPLQKTFLCTLRSADGERTFPCGSDLPLLASLEAAGAGIPANCANGECGFCRCRLVSGAVSFYDPPEADPRRRADAARSVIHVCRTFPDSDVTLAI